MGEYKGTTFGKNANRRFVWLQHKKLLGQRFKKTPHVFLASQYADDIPVLLEMGVKPVNVWAVESDEKQYLPLTKRQPKERFQLFTRQVEHVLPSSPQRSVYLDFCGNLQGARKALSRVAVSMPDKAVMSVTLMLGRETMKFESREKSLTNLLRKHSPHPVSLVQSVRYQSALKGQHGSAMGTYTYFFGHRDSRSKIRIDVSKMSLEELEELDPTAFWKERMMQAQVRIQAAIQANLTRL